MKYTDLVQIRPLADPRAVIAGETWRITVLTSRLFRLEYQPEGRFQDGATQMAVDRLFDVPAFTTGEDRGRLVVETEHVRLFYDRKPFSEHGLYAVLKGQFGSSGSEWHYGAKPRTLKGTVRTLDTIDGATPLGEGLNAVHGYAVADDSKSMTMDQQGNLHSAPEHGTDLYLFAYGHDFKACIRDFLHLSGPAPVVPRFALGNWWSRYYPYTQDEYMQLMKRFQSEGVPLSVSVLDMDWHVTKVPERFGTGWTGYTFNRDIIPDPQGFMAWLHQQGLKVTVNDHPADGVRACEEWYPAMAKELGVDPATEKPLAFDASSDAYFSAFEKCVMDPLEDMGVDFWWIDWQQAGGSTDAGVDPLFMLNHRYYRHVLEKGNARLIFSRYGGLGSHRYPLGFSGDTHVTWASLDFQPYFTATAANVAYGWWSHDVGGHMHGVRDGELTTRWMQFGVFSPINRLHSSLNRFVDKEPWKYPIEYRTPMTAFLRLRHRLIPWLYTQNVLTSRNREIMLRPVYFDYPGERALMRTDIYPNEYLLGDCLLVSPITEKRDAVSRLAAANTLIPQGLWYDLFTGDRYTGGQAMKLYRGLDTIPVLGKAGGFLPMDARDVPQNGAALPEHILLNVFTGAEGAGELIEDNGLMPGEEGYRQAVTRFRQGAVGDGYEIAIDLPAGDLSLAPEHRGYTVACYGFGNVQPDRCTCGYQTDYDEEKRVLLLTLEEPSAVISWDAKPCCGHLPVYERICAILRDAELSHDSKNECADYWEKGCTPMAFMAYVMAKGYPAAILGALTELFNVE